MRLSPLQLDSYFIAELSFEANLEFMEDDEPPKFADELRFADVKTEVQGWQDDADSRMWTYELTVHLPKSEPVVYPYSFRIVLLGLFRVANEYPEEKAALLAKVNGPAILYSSAREALAFVTGRGPHLPLSLPSVNFLPSAPPKGKKRPAVRTKGSRIEPKRKKGGTR